MSNGRYYVGYPGDPSARLVEHNAGKVTSTRRRGPWELVYTEEHVDATTARQREYRLKSMKSRVYLEALIRSVD